MAKDQLRDFHIFAMDSALPFGMGIINNAKTGGFKKIMNVLKSQDPFSEFQIAGKNSAKTVRDKIDQLVPGLGHPVVSVDVSVEKNSSEYEINYKKDLLSTLERIDTRLDKLRHFFNNDLKDIDND